MNSYTNEARFNGTDGNCAERKQVHGRTILRTAILKSMLAATGNTWDIKYSSLYRHVDKSDEEGILQHD